MPSSYTDTATDIVSVSGLHLSATIGPDHWHRTRPQPIQLSVYLHLSPSSLDAPGRSDDVSHSLHYGHLAKAVERRVGSRVEVGYARARELIDDVTDATFEFARDAGSEDKIIVVQAIQVVLYLQKRILLAGGFEMEATTSLDAWIKRRGVGAVVRVRDVTLPVLIGVNPPERLAQQRVQTDLTFFEAPRGAKDAEVDYAATVEEVVKEVQGSSYLTLEKLVYEIVRTGYRALGDGASRIEAITVRCRKPSALSFADASGVEMTRTRDTFASTNPRA